MANGVPIQVRVPDEIGPALIGRASRDNCTVQAVILSALANYLGVETPLRKRGGQPSKIATAKPKPKPKRKSKRKS